MIAQSAQGTSQSDWPDFLVRGTHDGTLAPLQTATKVIPLPDMHCLSTTQALADLIRQRVQDQPNRFLIAVAGPPGAGKSTLAANLAAALAPGAKTVPMDGFHLDDRVLLARGLRDRKGAPETFDVAGFLHLLDRLRREAEVAIPLFDRDLEISRAGAEIVTPADRILLVEGNYLLLNQDPWRQAAPLFDLTVWLDVPEPELDRRLLARWAHYGKTPEAARAWIDGNDMPNIRRVVAGSRGADVVVGWGSGADQR